MSINHQMVYLTVACACAVVASVTDLRSRRIPNRLTGPAILVGLLLHLALGGPTQLGLSALAGLIAGGIFLLFFVACGMGGGDVKLMAAVGCLAGTAYIKDILIATVLIGAVMGIVLALYHGRLRSTFSNVFALVGHHGSKGLVTHPELHVKNPATLRLPYALPIALGCMVAVFISYSREFAR
jgi:prepilin peptidase CpaA